MDTLKVSVLRCISCFYQCLEAGFHQCAYTAAENCLLAEQVGLSLNFESSLQNTCSCSAQCCSVSQCSVFCFSCVILLYSYQTRNTFSYLILASYCMTRSLRSDHGNVNVSRRFDLSEMDSKAVCEHEHITFFQVRLNIFFVHSCLFLIVDQNHDDISLFCSFCCCINF